MNSAINLLVQQRNNLEISLQNTRRELQEAEKRVMTLGARIVRMEEELVESNEAITKLEQ